MAARNGGSDRLSTKARFADELVILGRILVLAREKRGLKQSDVAMALGLPASYLSKVENGTRRLDAIEFIRIAEAMEVDAAELIGDLQRALAEEKR